jgi:ABC-type nitrate/sulfonate/bicarbonate transport system permease component
VKRLVVPLLCLAGWEVMARSPIGDPIYSPSLLGIAGALWTLVASGELFTHLGASAVRVAAGFSLGLVLGVPFGLATGYWPFVHRNVSPVLEVLRAFPSITLVPIAMVWFGIGDAAKIFLVAYASFWPIFLNSVTGARETSPLLLKAASVMELDRSALFRDVVFPSALPSILTGVRVSLAVAVIVLIVSEMIGASRGIGYLIIDAERNYLTGKMFAGVIVMGAIGATLNGLAARAQAWFLRHRETA